MTHGFVELTSRFLLPRSRLNATAPARAVEVQWPGSWLQTATLPPPVLDKLGGQSLESTMALRTNHFPRSCRW